MIRFFVCNGLILFILACMGNTMRWAQRTYPHPQSDFFFLAFMALLFFVGFLIDLGDKKRALLQLKRQPRQIDCHIVDLSDYSSADVEEPQLMLTHLNPVASLENSKNQPERNY